MYRFAFISRHQPTIEQQEMAATAGIELVHVGDVEAFRGDVVFVLDSDEAGFNGIWLYYRSLSCVIV